MPTIKVASRTSVLFRWTGRNMYTVSVLMGLLDDKLSSRTFSIGTLEDLSGLTEHLKKPGCCVLAYSFTSIEAEQVKKEITALKKAYGGAITVICGGPHCSAAPDEVLGWGVDAVFTGEAEESLPFFLNELNKGKAQLKTIVQPLPLSDFNDYPPFAYKRAFFAPIELGRGCGSRCSFCQTPSIFPVKRERSVNYVKKYGKYIKTSKRMNAFFTIPDALLYGSDKGVPEPGKLEDFLREVTKSGVSVHMGNFPSEIGPRSLSAKPECARILKKYVSNTKIIVGGQSGSQNVLGIMKRDHTVEHVRDSVKILRAGGFTPIVDILFGVPGETAHDRAETLSFMERLAVDHDARLNIHYFTPLPGTHLAGSTPEKIEDTTKERVMELMRNGIARGDFFKRLP